MATLVGASGGGFLGGARLAVTPLLGGPASGALGSALPGPQDLDATGLNSLLFRSRAKTRAPWLEKWGTISLEEVNSPIEGRPRVYKSDAVGLTEGL